MTITRSEIISSVAGVCAAAAAVTSAMALSAAPTFVGTADIKLGKLTQVENWEHTPASFGSSCTLKGIISYDVKGPETLTGNIGGAIQFEHGREWVSGSMVNGEGSVRINMYAYNEDVCDLKKSGDIEVEEAQLHVQPAVVSTAE